LNDLIAHPHAIRHRSRLARFLTYLQWVWHRQVHPGRLPSSCRLLSSEGFVQNEEVNGGQVPRGYPRQEVPVGPGVVSGMCLMTDIRLRAYQPNVDRSVQECTH